MVNERPDFSISIACWNNLPMLLDCIRSLLETCGSLSLEILVIDDASDPPLCKGVHKEFPDVLVLRNDKHHSFSQSQNKVLRKARGKYVIVLNDDTYFHDGALQAVYDEFEADPRVGMTAPRVEAPEGDLDPAAIRPEPTACELITRYNYTRLRKLRRLVRADYYDAETKHDIEVGSGACMAIRRATVDEIGLLDEGFRFYFEDVDWMVRVRRAGWVLRYVPQARVTHYGAVSAKKLNLDRELYHYYATRYYLSKWCPPGTVGAHRLLSAANYFIRAIYWRVVALTNLHGHIAMSRATGYWRLYRTVLVNPDHDIQEHA